MKRCLVISKKVPFPSFDGESLVVAADIEALAAAGVEVYVYCVNTSKHFRPIDSVLHHPAVVKVFSHKVFTNSIFQITKKLKKSGNQWYLHRFYSSKIHSEIYEIIQKYAINGVLYQGLPMLLYKIENQSIRLLYRVHNVEQNIWRSNLAFLSKHNSLKNSFRRAIFSQILNQIEVFEYKNIPIDTISLQTAECNFFKEIYPNQNHYTVPISLPPKNYTWHYPEGDFTILIMGSMEWIPNAEGTKWFLDSVWPRISQQFQNCKIKIAGRNASKLSFKNNIGVEVVDSFTHLEAIIKKCHLMIIPVFSGAGIRIKALEALQLGIPTISTSLGVDGIPYQNCIEIANTEIEFLEKITYFYENKEQLIAQSEKMKNVYNIHFQSNKIVSKWKELLN